MAKMTGSQIIVNLLRQNNINIVFGLPGGMILPLYNELFVSKMKHVLVRQEQAAGFMAQGVARVTGKAAVCMATSGPGAMNLLTAVADARADSVPLVAITGQVNTDLIGTDAFQEADTFGLSFPITKHSMMVKSAKELLKAVPLAFAIAESGRPGPVLIDVPKNVQTEIVEVGDDFEGSFRLIYDEYLKKAEAKKTPESEIPSIIRKFAEKLENAKKPVLYIGGGANNPKASSEIRKFISKYKIPCVSSLMGLGVVPHNDAKFFGMVGMHGSLAANKAMYESDCVLVAGARFDDRATGVVEKFCPEAVKNRSVLHIDIDAAEVNKIIESDFSLIYDTALAFEKLNEIFSEKKLVADGNSVARESWFKRIEKFREEEKITLNMDCYAADCCGEKSCGRKNASEYKNPRALIASLPSNANVIITTDVGQHQMWTAQFYDTQRPRQLLTSGSLGTMGFGLPAAIGAAFAEPEKRVICVSGDGSILMNIQELATLAENNLNVTVIVLENGALGMVRQQQEYLFGKNYSASIFMSNPDFLKIAEGFGLRVVNADTDSDWQKKAFGEKGPCFVLARIARYENVLPFVKAGSANIDPIM